LAAAEAAAAGDLAAAGMVMPAIGQRECRGDGEEAVA
jgi:hypothetical protein